jgi:23S rRNA (uracil1939-C5)-methyltransferase
VGREDGKTVFAPFGAPGDKARLHRREDHKNFSRAWIASVEEASPDRAEPPCPVFFRPGNDPDKVCGGCAWQHLSYEAQLKNKRALLIEAFQRLARIAHPVVDETVPCPSPFRYRNKVQIPLAMDSGKLVAGFYAPASHKVVPFQDCLIQSERQNAAVRAALEWLNRRPPAVYDAAAGRGWLRHLYLRESAAGELLVALIVKDSAFPKGGEFASFLAERCPSVKSVFLNVNPRPGNVVLGPEWHLVAGRPFLQEELMGLRLRLSPGAFFQVNHAMAEKLYGTAVAFADPAPEDQVLELYAGMGVMGMLMAPKAARVWAVEENAQAVKDGIESSGLNGISNVRFVVGRCEEALTRRRPRLELAGKPVVALLDPPRAGCDPQVLKAVMHFNPKRIVYVSCDPATLARDAKYLSTGGYLLRRAVPVDLFPQTAHIESVSLFSK